MELDSTIKQKLTERFLKILGDPFSPVVEDIYIDLLNGVHSIEVITRGKYTIAEILYQRNGYTHHFLGVSARNPNDEADTYYGVKVAVEKALGELFQKFYFEEQYREMRLN